MTGRDDKLPSVLVLAQDGRTAPLRTLGETPLMLAALSGHGAVVKILLRRDEVNPGKADNEGGTPLIYAAKWGHQGIVRTLLVREVNPNKSDNKGRTPFSHAAEGGHAGVVKILLEQKGVNPNKSDNGNQTPLMWAAKSGHRMVEALLQPYEAVIALLQLHQAVAHSAI